MARTPTQFLTELVRLSPGIMAAVPIQLQISRCLAGPIPFAQVSGNVACAPLLAQITFIPAASSTDIS
jgi:hypothetical protein